MAHSAGVDQQHCRGGGGGSGVDSAMTVEQLVQQRLQERATRKGTAQRLDRFASIAMEARHRTSAGITEDLLRQKRVKAAHGSDQQSSSGDTCTSANPSENGTHRTERTASAGSVASQKLRGLNAFTDPRSTAGSSASSSVVTSCRVVSKHGACGGVGPPQGSEEASRKTDLGPYRRIGRLSGKQSGVANRRDSEDDDDDDDAELENGGHICVVTTRTHDLLFSSSTSRRPSGSNDSACQPHHAGAIPLSLRGLAATRHVENNEGPVGCSPGDADSGEAQASVKTSDRMVVPSPPLKPTAAASEVPRASSGRKVHLPVRTEGWTNNHGGGPKSILKRHPIPRRHKRRVTFHPDVDQAVAGASLRLSKDGPPVAFTLPDGCGGSPWAGTEQPEEGEERQANWMSTVVMPRSKGAAEGKGLDENRGGGWGADSETFNYEWGLKSPVRVEKKPGARGRGGGTSRGGTAGTARRGEEDQQRRQILLSSLTFHTGLSMEEARLLAAIADVNSRMQQAGFVSQASASEPQPSRLTAKESARCEQAQSAAPPVVNAQEDRLIGVNEEPRRQTLLPAPSSAQPQRGLGGILVDPFSDHVSASRARGSSAPPPASTSRYAPSHTMRNESCHVVAAPQEQFLPSHVTAALPKRKSDHQGLTRRDRFGKKMSLIGR